MTGQLFPDLSPEPDLVDRSAPLAARMRPRSLEELVGQEHVVGQGSPLRALIETDRLSSVILWGPPGTGKTSLAAVIARTTRAHYIEISAVSAGVADVRRAIATGREMLKANRRTILFIDEIHRFNKSQQDALLKAVESGWVVLIGATTENPFFEVNSPLLSRSLLFRLEALSPEQVRTVVDRALSDRDRGVAGAGVTFEPAAIDRIIDMAGGDARFALNAVEVCVAAATAAGTAAVMADDVNAALQRRVIRYEFIARRMVIFASEDVGNADPMALVVAVAAFDALRVVGLPEASLNLSQAVTYLASAPKSNASTIALGRARADLAESGQQAPPLHLRDASYVGAKRLGHGKGYRYPHDFPGAWVDQEYLPGLLPGQPYYEPTDRGVEKEIGDRLRAIRGAKGKQRIPSQDAGDPG